LAKQEKATRQSRESDHITIWSNAFLLLRHTSIINDIPVFYFLTLYSDEEVGQEM
jgi:hypothetical protein